MVIRDSANLEPGSKRCSDRGLCQSVRLLWLTLSLFNSPFFPFPLPSLDDDDDDGNGADNDTDDGDDNDNA